MVLSDNTLLHFIWRHRYFKMEDRTPKFHYGMVEHFLDATPEDNVRVVKAFRGSAKSANVCFLALHRVELPDAYFTMIVSATATLAEGLIADIKNMIAASVLPYTVVRSVANEIQLRYDGKDYYILGAGSGSALRGTKRGGRRADLILTDDLMTTEIAANRLRVARLVNWYYSDLRPSLNPSNGVMWAVGTPMTTGDIFALLAKNNPTLEIPLTLDAWPDRFSENWITRTKQEYTEAGTLRLYKQEFELILADSENQLFDMQKIRFIDESNIPNDLTWFMFCDLAFSEKESADYSALVCVGLDKMGRWYVYPHQGRWKPSETAQQIVDLVNRFHILDVHIEGGSSYMAVVEHLEALRLQYEDYFNIIEMSHLGKSKLSRISALEPVVNVDKLIVIDNGDSAEQLIDQMQFTTIGGCVAKHDDLLDALSMGVRARMYYTGERVRVALDREDYEEAMQHSSPNDDLWDN